MGMNIQKSAGVKADTFILKRNNMDRWIRMDVAMLIILAICTRLVAGIMNVEKMDAYTGSGEGFCKAVSESHGVDMVKDCFELGTQKVLDVKKTAKSVCKSVTIKKTMQDVIRPTETEEIIPEVKGVPEAKDGKAACSPIPLHLSSAGKMQRNRRTCTGWNFGCGRSLYSGEYYFCCTRSIGEDRRTYVY